MMMLLSIHLHRHLPAGGSGLCAKALSYEDEVEQMEERWLVLSERPG